MNPQNQRIAKMTFASVYPMYLAKVEKKGRTKEEPEKKFSWAFKIEECKHNKAGLVTYSCFLYLLKYLPNIGVVH